MKIDLRSDTFTQPTDAMRDVMRHAKVGDDVFGEDPSIHALEDQVARLLGTEAALFCPTATMCNQIAIKVNTRPLDEIICDRLAHIYNYEVGGYAFLSACSIRTIETERGLLQVEDIVQNINPDDVHKPITRLVCLENTCNKGGGSIYPFALIQEISRLCAQKKLALHLDGSRLFNAWVMNHDPLQQYGQLFDTITICLSKGLGCPAGAVLAGKKELIKEARRVRKVLGGGMRQAGILAAAGIYALNNHLTGLLEDNKKAAYLGRVIGEQPYVQHCMPVESNIIIFRLKDHISATGFAAYLAEKDIHAFAIDHNSIRFVTHLDIHDDMIPVIESALLSYKGV
jgi:threonine aldolase